MKIKELRERIAGLPDDLPVILSIDPEGNGFRELSDVDIGEPGAERVWDPDDKEIGYGRLTNRLRAVGYGDEDILGAGDRCVVLWP